VIPTSSRRSGRPWTGPGPAAGGASGRSAARVPTPPARLSVMRISRCKSPRAIRTWPSPRGCARSTACLRSAAATGLCADQRSPAPVTRGQHRSSGISGGAGTFPRRRQRGAHGMPGARRAGRSPGTPPTGSGRPRRQCPSAVHLRSKAAGDFLPVSQCQHFPAHASPDSLARSPEPPITGEISCTEIP
jgi:hypothetical protein